MNEGTALEIADRLDGALRWPILIDAASMLREQHAEIERLSSINSDLVKKSNAYVIENARQAEEIERLRTFVQGVIRYAGNTGDDYLCDVARAALVDE